MGTSPLLLGTGTQMEKEEEEPQAQKECLRDAVKAQIPPASLKGFPVSVPSSFDKTRLHQTPLVWHWLCVLSPFARLLL